MKSSKADGAKYTQMNGAATPGETGPLFPRLHISETEKAGPRAPPRNKMALFEQFTVPSHRFVQPSRPSTAVSKQKQQFVPNDYRYPYVSYYTPSSVPYSNINHGISSDTQPSHGISSCVTSSSSALVTDHESQRASGSQTGEKSVEVSRATRKEDGSSTLSSWLDQKGKVPLNDNVPMQSWPRAQGKDVPGMLYVSGGSENPNDKFDSVESAERPIITNIRSGLQETTSTVEAVLACPVVEVRSCGVQERTEVNDNNTGIDDMHLKSLVSKPIAEVFNEQNHDSLLTAPGEVCQQPVHGTEVIQLDKALPEDLLQVNELGEGGKNNCLQDSADISMAREPQDRPLSGNSLVDNTQVTLAREPPSGLPRGSKDTQKRCCPSDGDKGDSSAGGLSVDSLSKDKDESMGESYVNQIGSNEASELSQHGNGLRGYCDDSPSSVLAAEAIRPTDVIRAVGQQQFWKARKALLRQQRIFSDQVFQLHKLIKVQQLLAETPGTFIDEEMAFGDMDVSAASPSPRDFTQREHCLGEKVHNAGPYFEKSKKGQASERTQPKTTQKPEWFTPVGNDDIGSNPYFPAFSLGGTSAWGYPSVGMGQWMGPIAAPGRPSAYQPFTGTFPPGAPYGGLYASATLGPISPQFPFGIPYSGQRSEAWEAMSSNHDPEAGSNHQATTGVGHTPVNMANDLSGAWHFWHYSNPFYNQRSTASVSEKVVPTGSGASINNHRPAKPVHPSGMHLPEGHASHAGALNTNALEGAAHHCEVSPPSTPRGSKFKSFSGTLPAPLPKKAGSRHQEVEHPAQNDVFQNQSFKQYKSNRAGGGEEVNRTALRWLKHQQDRVPLNRKHCEETFVDRSSDYSGNALDLFPLVPSLSSDGQDGPNQGRERWQGRVIKAVPHPAVAASQSAAGILLSIQRERQQ